MKFVLTLALATAACGPVTRMNEAETTDNRRAHSLPEASSTQQTTDDTSPAPQTALTPAPNQASQAVETPAPNQAPKPVEMPTPAHSPATQDSPSPEKTSDVTPPSPPVVEELEIEERTGQAEDFSEHALIFDLDEYGNDKRQLFERAPAFTVPEWVSGLGFLFPETAHAIRYDTTEGMAPFRGWVAHAAVRLFQYQKEKSTVFRLTLFGDETSVAKAKDDDHGKDKGKEQNNGKGHEKDKEDKGKKQIKSRSRLIVELAVKNGRPLLQLQTKVAGQKNKNARVKGKARIPANQEVHLVASLKGNMLRLFTGTHLIAETKVDPIEEKWTRGELIIGASHDHGKAPFVGFLKEFEFADSVPIEYQ